MYIDPFWAGVCATIVVEIMLIILAGILKGLFGHPEDAEIETHQIELPEDLQRQIAEEIEKQMKGGNKKDGV